MNSAKRNPCGIMTNLVVSEYELNTFTFGLILLGKV